MDLIKVIRELREEKKRIDKAIAALEKFLKAGEAVAKPRQKRRRGRTSMPEAERRQVSQRMKKYWEMRRRAKTQEQ